MAEHLQNLPAPATILCAFTGDVNVFHVKIDTNKSISHWKEAIKAVKPDSIRQSYKLRLYLAKKKNGAWVTEAGVKQRVKDTNGLKELDIALAIVRRVGLSVAEVANVGHDEVEKGYGRVNVLVVVPSIKRSRLDNLEEFDNVPQINIEGAEYVTLPAELVRKCGLGLDGDLMLYCRPQLHELWNFLRDEVVSRNRRALIVGPPGSGKSACALSFVVSLDRREWNVVWIHLNEDGSLTCLAVETKELWKFAIGDRVELPHIPNKKRFVCLDGYEENGRCNAFVQRIDVQLRSDDRLVICSSVRSLGRRNEQDDRVNTSTVLYELVDER